MTYLQVLSGRPSSSESSHAVAQAGQSANVSHTGRSCGVQLHVAAHARESQTTVVNPNPFVHMHDSSALLQSYGDEHDTITAPDPGSRSQAAVASRGVEAVAASTHTAPPGGAQ
jgi:hypothetical protein